MTNTPAPNIDRLLSLPEVERLVGLRSSALYARIERGTFPAPLRVSSRCSRWRETEILGWIAALPRGCGPRPGAEAAA